MLAAWRAPPLARLGQLFGEVDESSWRRCRSSTTIPSARRRHATGGSGAQPTSAEEITDRLLALLQSDDCARAAAAFAARYGALDSRATVERLAGRLLELMRPRGA